MDQQHGARRGLTRRARVRQSARYDQQCQGYHASRSAADTGHFKLRRQRERVFVSEPAPMPLASGQIIHLRLPAGAFMVLA